MPRIQRIFTDLAQQNRKALMPFICGDFPAVSSTSQLLLALQSTGASIVEVGFPFSDPIADGPVIASAMFEALKQGSTPTTVFAGIRAAREAGCTLGIIAMVSVSLITRMGQERFMKEARDAGVDGLIVPDVPLEESTELTALAARYELTCSLLVGPATSDERAAQIARACTGFVYVLARAGITGTAQKLDVAPIARRVQQLRTCTKLPLAIGFGISTPEQVRAVVQEAGADAAIVGSALIQRITQASPENWLGNTQSFVRELAAGL